MSFSKCIPSRFFVLWNNGGSSSSLEDYSKALHVLFEYYRGVYINKIWRCALMTNGAWNVESCHDHECHRKKTKLMKQKMKQKMKQNSSRQSMGVYLVASKVASELACSGGVFRRLSLRLVDDMSWLRARNSSLRMQGGDVVAAAAAGSSA